MSTVRLLNRCLSVGLLATFALLAGQISGEGTARAEPATQPAPAMSAAEISANTHAAIDASLRAALDRQGWTQAPRPVYRARHSGPTPQTLHGVLPPIWYQSTSIGGNSRANANEEQERQFVTSIEGAYRGKTSLILGGEIVLVDSQKRIWAVGEHTAHILRCYDGKGWTYRRSDGLPSGADAVADFFRDNPPNAPRKFNYAPGGLRDLLDPGQWFNVGCEDAAGNLHFVGGSGSEEAERKSAGGWGIHTLRPDGAWSFFRIYPVRLSKHDAHLGGLRAVLHRPAARDPAATQPATQPAGAATRPIGGARAGDLVTLASLRLSDPIARALGQDVIPIPPDKDKLRFQSWKEHADQPRYGPTFLLRFNGKNWRLDRAAIGWGTYDTAFQVWPQPDGRMYIANRFGLWLEQPPGYWTPKRIDALINDFFAAEQRTRLTAAQTLQTLGDLAVPILREAIDEAALDSSRQKLRALLAKVQASARGEESAVPAVNGQWRFESTIPEATAPDGRFAFHCKRAIDVLDNKVISDCLVFFDPRKPAGEEFEIRPIDRPQWAAAGYFDKRPLESARGKALDNEGCLWVVGGFRCNKEGRLERMVPPGLAVHDPYLIDAKGRVYFGFSANNSVAMMIYRPDAGGGAAVATRPAGGPATQPGELVLENVEGIFRQPDLMPPWNAWAVQFKDGQRRLLRLDGPEPTVVPTPFANEAILAVVPLDGGCIVSTRRSAAFWAGKDWDVADDVFTLIQRHGRILAKMVPTRVFAYDTSKMMAGGAFDHQLLLASDGASGLWLAEDSNEGGRRLMHWDGDRFTDLWKLIPLEHRRREDGGLMTIGGGRALIVQVYPDFQTRPGGYWSIWRITDADVREKKVPLQTVNAPGLYPRLIAALGPNTIFSHGIWTDRQGWAWSPIFSDTGQQWVRRRDAKAGYTPLTRGMYWGFVQSKDGPIWACSGGMVWADVGEPTDDRPGTFPRNAWVGTHIPAERGSGHLAAAPDGTIWLFHQAGLSQLQLKRLKPGEKPPTPMRELGGQPATQPAGEAAAATPLAIVEVARHEWTLPRNDFSQIAFDATGIWFRGGRDLLIRVEKPKAPNHSPATQPVGP